MRPKLKLTLLLAATVMLFAIIGTISHEAGHAAVGWTMGWRPRIHYAFTTFDGASYDPQLMELAERYEPQIRARQAFPGSAVYYAEERKARKDRIACIWGGPLQTMLSGTVGFVLLLSQWRAYRNSKALSPGKWLILFLTLFWLREPANLIVGCALWLFTGRYSISDDESQLSMYYGFPPCSMLLITSLLTFGICLVVFRAIPRTQRGNFILAFIIGVPLGAALWLGWLGPALLP